MEKKATAIIIILAIITGLSITALIVPAFGQAAYSFATDYLGPNIVNGATFVLTAPLAWGAQGIATAAATWAIIGICLGSAYIVGKRVIWNRFHKAKPKEVKIPADEKYQSQLSTPELYVPPKTTQTQKEKVEEPEPTVQSAS